MTATNVQKFTFSMIALALLFGVLAVSSSSTADGAEHSPVAITGTTTLKPTKQMIRKLKRAKVRVTPTGSATGGLRKLVFPVTGGLMHDEPYLGGLPDEVRHQGSGFKILKRVDGTTPSSLASISADHREAPTVSFRNPVMDLGRGILNFSMEGMEKDYGVKAIDQESRRIAVFRLSVTDIQDGPSNTMLRAKLKLTGQGARLFRRLGLNVKKGTPYGIIGVLVS